MNRLTPALPWATNQIIDTHILSQKLPEFNRYIEPFFGGGQFFHSFNTPKTALLNDKNHYIIDFYRLLQSESSGLKTELFNILDHWKLIDNFFEVIKKDLAFVESDLKARLISYEDVPYLLRTIFSLNLTLEEFEVIYTSKTTPNADLLIDNLISACMSYLKSSSRHFQHFDFNAKILQNGYYYYLRELFNGWTSNSKIPSGKKLAVWYFINMLGYSARVTYSLSENHHLPISSNAPSYQEIASEINRIFIPDYINKFSKARFFSLDFAEFLRKTDLNEDDFIFVDPPFNSKWIHYEDSVLSREQQRELAAILSSTKTKWMLVMKASDFHPEFFDRVTLDISEPETVVNTGDRFIIATNY